MLLQFYRVTLIFSAFIINLTLSVVFEYGYDNFPVEKVALHMPCEESNMFATKCMCHIICSDPKCENAKSLCEKYQKRLIVNKFSESVKLTTLIHYCLYCTAKAVNICWFEKLVKA